MKEYLKMEDAFSRKVDPITDWDEHGHEVRWITLLSHQAEHAAHAINSHDELVQMNQELLAALESVIEWYDMEADHSIEPDFYKRMAACQVSEDMAREAIAKAKGGAS